MPTPRLNASQALELADFLDHPHVRGLGRDDAIWHAHITYARRAAVALATNDLEAALRAANISTHALVLWRQYRRDEPSGRSGEISNVPF